MFKPMRQNAIDRSRLGFNDSVFLNENEYKSFNTAVIQAPEQPFTLLDAFPISQKDPNKEFYAYDIETSHGTAGIVQSPSDFPALSIDGTRATIQIPMKGISFRIKKTDIANSRLLGERLDTAYARNAGIQVKKLQDEALYSKSSVFGTLGIESQASGAFSGTNWSTSTTDIYDQVRQIINAIPAAFRSGNAGNYVIVLNTTQYSELFKGTWNNGSVNEQVTAGTWWKKIKDNFPNTRIIESQWVTATEGVAFPFLNSVVERIVSIANQAVEMDDNFMEVSSAAIAADVLIVYQASAVVKITGI